MRYLKFKYLCLQFIPFKKLWCIWYMSSKKKKIKQHNPSTKRENSKHKYSSPPIVSLSIISDTHHQPQSKYHLVRISLTLHRNAYVIHCPASQLTGILSSHLITGKVRTVQEDILTNRERETTFT